MATTKTEEDYKPEITEHEEYCGDCDNHHFPLRQCHPKLTNLHGLDTLIASLEEKYQQLEELNRYTHLK